MQLLLNNNLVGNFKYYTTYGRTALYVALLAVNVEHKEVILPAFTCNTTALAAVLQAGGIPVFVDIEPTTFNMDLDDLKNKITSNTIAVMSHHYYGFMTTNLEDIRYICKDHNLFHIEDCAHSLGASFDDKLAGFWGDIAVYSFSKSCLNPAGGCVSTNNEVLASKLRKRFDNNSFLDELFKNYYCFEHLCGLFFDIKEKNHPFRQIINGKTGKIISLTQKILGYNPQKIYGLFYNINSVQEYRPDLVMNIAMTNFQYNYIKGNMLKYNILVEKKKNLFEKLQKVTTLPINIDKIKPNYSNFLLNVDNKMEIIDKAHNKGIRLRETWPAFHEYWPEQITQNVRFIKDNYLIINLEQYLEKQEKLEKFFYENLN